MKRINALAAVAGLAVSAARADPPVAAPADVVSASVRRLARITPDGRIGPWIEAGPGGLAPPRNLPRFP